MSKVQEKRAVRPSRRLSPINTAAAGIDIDATFHVVAVGEERCERPKLGRGEGLVSGRRWPHAFTASELD
jgi:hypothetical protein